MIRIYLCDDNPGILARYQRQISEICLKSKELITIKTTSSAAQLTFELAENPNVADILFLDIELGKENGLVLAKNLRNLQYRGEIIFLSTYSQYIFNCFDVSPFYYIIKGQLSKSKFSEIVTNAIALASQKNRDVFCFERKGNKTQIPIRDISHFTVNSRIITVFYNTDESFDFYCSINDLLDQLSSQEFVKCHRSFIVNLKYITTIKNRSVYLKNGVTIPVSKSCIQPLKLAFSQFLSQSTYC